MSEPWQNADGLLKFLLIVFVNHYIFPTELYDTKFSFLANYRVFANGFYPG